MKEIIGDLWDQEADAICLTTNGFVKNCGRAVMGAGVALQAKQRWPEIDLKLGSHIKDKGNMVGVVYWYREPKFTYIVSFPVKNNWFENADLKLIEKSCKELVALADMCQWKKIIVPKPGCANGKLQWKEVKPLCEKYFDDRFIIIDRR